MQAVVLYVPNNNDLKWWSFKTMLGLIKTRSVRSMIKKKKKKAAEANVHDQEKKKKNDGNQRHRTPKP